MTEQHGTPPTVAITGAAGFIGSCVAKIIQDEHPNWELIALDNFYLGEVRDIDGISVQHVDIRHRTALEQALDGADVVLHLAAISGVDDCRDNPDLAYEVNVQGTNNVAWFCRQTGAALVFPFSMATLGDPESFPITVEAERDPMNWYGRTKVLGERAIETFAADAFPAHLYLKSNLYGEHHVGGRRITKGTVINFFVDRVFSDDPITVYEPGTQARNYIHVKDVARAYLRSAERLVEQREAGETGVWTYEIASDEDPSILSIGELVRNLAVQEVDIETDVEVVPNPRDNETIVSEFAVDTTKAKTELGWEPTHTIEDTVKELLRRRAE